MPKFKEFIGAFKKDYNEEEKETYKHIYSEESEWPGYGEYDEAPCAIDLDFVIAFNPHTDDDKTTVDIRGGNRLALKITYQEFAAIMKTFYSFV